MPRNKYVLLELSLLRTMPLQRFNQHWPKLAQCASCLRDRASAQRGQSITEYAIIGVLIIVVSIGALTLFGKNLNGILGALSNSATDPSLVSVKPKLISAPPVSGPTVLNSAPLAPATNIPLSAQASSQANAQPLQTVGVNGETEQYSQQILKAAQQALANGKIDQAQYDLMVQMANQGHEMAVMEGLLQNSYQQGKTNPDGFYGTFITYKGQPYTPAVFSRLLNDANNNMQQLQNQLFSANSGQPDLLNTVTSAASQIHSIAADHVSSMDNADSASIKRLLDNSSASSASNQQSAAICAAGQHLDVNNHCVN